MESATECIKSVLGPMGRMLEAGRNTNHNQIITIGALGKVWYGDINFVADADALIYLEKHFGPDFGITA